MLSPKFYENLNEAIRLTEEAKLLCGNRNFMRLLNIGKELREIAVIVSTKTIGCNNSNS